MCECNGSGVLQDKLFPGAILIRPCDCPAASRNREMAERELREMLAEVRMLRGIYHAACVGNDPGSGVQSQEGFKD